MIAEKTKVSIVCDIGGCQKKATHFIKRCAEECNYDSLKLCDDCIKDLSKVLSKIIKKENDSEKQKN